MSTENSPQSAIPTATVPETTPTTAVASATDRDGTPQRTGVAPVGYFSRDQKNKRSRDWAKPEGEPAEKKSRKPKVKVALVFGYIGTNYQGLQVNPGCTSIEETLFNSMVKSGAISEENSNSFSKVKWSRASRTDKGVHAARNIVNLKMIVDDDAIEKINHNLPEDIRVYGHHRVVNSFNCKNHCESRRYEYILPTYVLDTESTAVGAVPSTLSSTPASTSTSTAVAEPTPAVATTTATVLPAEAEASSSTSASAQDSGKGKQKAAAAARGGGGGDDEDEEDEEEETNDIVDFYGVNVTPEMLPKFSTEDVVANTNYNYRITNDKLEQLRRLLATYHGTHDYHNFTSRGKFKNKPKAQDYCKRFMKSFTVGEPFLMDGLEYVPLRVWGQSFMLHQIRKMIGTVVCIMRGVMDEPTLKKALTFNTDIILPLAPGLGLILDTVYFDGYNQKYGKTWGRLDLSVFDAQAAEFKKRIYADIIKQELASRTCAEWVYSLSDRSKVYGVGRVVPPEVVAAASAPKKAHVKPPPAKKYTQSEPVPALVAATTATTSTSAADATTSKSAESAAESTAQQ